MTDPTPKSAPVPVLAPPKKNLICNFRAPSEEQFFKWKEYVAWCQANGRDVCYLTLSLAESFMLGVKGATAIRDPNQTINIQMNNTFTYQVARPRREPYDLSCVKPEYRKTFASVCLDGYVLNKARDLNREFSFRDFLELRHDAFRRIVRRLVRKGKLVANPQRTVPRFYFLPELIGDYSPSPGRT